MLSTGINATIILSDDRESHKCILSVLYNHASAFIIGATDIRIHAAHFNALFPHTRV